MFNSLFSQKIIFSKLNLPNMEHLFMQFDARHFFRMQGTFLAHDCTQDNIPEERRSAMTAYAMQHRISSPGEDVSVGWTSLYPIAESGIIRYSTDHQSLNDDVDYCHWVVAKWNVEIDRRFRRRSPGWWSSLAPLKCQSISIRPHVATSQTTVIFVLAAVRTWNLKSHTAAVNTPSQSNQILSQLNPIRNIAYFVYLITQWTI